MIRALRLLRASFSAWYYDVFVLIGANVVWLALSLLILPIGPATAGLFYVCNEVAKGEPISFSMFWAGMKRYGVLSVKLAAVLIIITVLLIVNVSFYFELRTSVGQVLGFIFTYLIVFWAFLLNYPFALLVQMERPSVLRILRNSALLTLDNIRLTVSLSLVTLLLMFLSIFPLGFVPYLVGLFALLAIFQCKALALLMEKYEQKPQAAASAPPAAAP